MLHKKYKALCAKMDLEGIDRPQVCTALCRSRSYVDQHFAGKLPFTLKDVYTICSLVGIPLSEICTYFPPEESGVSINKNRP